MKTKVYLSVPGQKGGTERLVLRCLSVPGQDVLSRDRRTGTKGLGQNVPVPIKLKSPFFSLFFRGI